MSLLFKLSKMSCEWAAPPSPSTLPPPLHSAPPPLCLPFSTLPPPTLPSPTLFNVPDWEKTVVA